MVQTSGGLVRANAQWTPEQHAWLQSEAKRLGLKAVAAAARFHIQQAMTAAEAAKETAA